MSLNKRIISCKKCLDLLNLEKKLQMKKENNIYRRDYWGKPITGFGDLKAKTIIIGLAPAAHGGNRTGRVFTGDKSLFI